MFYLNKKGDRISKNAIANEWLMDKVGIAHPTVSSECLKLYLRPFEEGERRKPLSSRSHRHPCQEQERLP